MSFQPSSASAVHVLVLLGPLTEGIVNTLQVNVYI